MAGIQFNEWIPVLCLTTFLGLPLTWVVFHASSLTYRKKLPTRSSASTPTQDYFPEEVFSEPTIEISVSDIESAYQSWLGGANSLEICSNRNEGGTTPSLGFVEECISRFQLPNAVSVHVLIRPRPGNFKYSGDMRWLHHHLRLSSGRY